MKPPVFFVLLAMMAAQAADKKPLDHSVYDSWRSISETSLSRDGRYLLYTLVPQEGDAELQAMDLASRTKVVINRGNKSKFSRDSRYVIAHIQPFFQDTRKARIAKKKEDDMPKDSLLILRLADSNIHKIGRVQSYQLPEKGDGWLAYQLAKAPAKKDSTKNGKKKDQDADEKDAKDKKGDKASEVVIRRLQDGREWTFQQISEYKISKKGNRIVLASVGKDSTEKAGVRVFDTTTLADKAVLAGKGTYKQLVWDEEGNQLVFLADRDTSKSKQRFFKMYCWTTSMDSARLLADTLTTKMPRHWLISEQQAPQFSKDGAKVYFGLAPIPVPDDTTLVDFETAKLDIWHWQDAMLQTQQIHDLDKEKKRSYTAVMLLKEKSLLPLANVDLPEIRLADEGDGRYVLGLSNIPYLIASSWEGRIGQDLYLIDTTTGAPTLMAKKMRGNVSWSPKGKYVLWFDEEKGHWFSYNIAIRTMVNLTSSLPVRVTNEWNDKPDYPESYGSAGWTENDRRVLIYDRFDIWELDPEGKAAARNLTQGLGRREQVRYRYVSLDPEERFIKPGQTLLLKTFDEKDKSEGLAEIRLEGQAAPRSIFHAAQSLGSPLKAADADVYAFTRGSFTEFPNLWITDGRFQNLRQLSDANPQQKEYSWGSVELVKWMSNDGKPLEGLLYKPENFDSRKKYPLIVYFYERNADGLHRHIDPRPSRSTVSPVFYASRGYCFFIPDIVYEIGYPGKSALSCIVPGVQKLVEQGFIDKDRIGIQGQSWGGYQVAYLVTHTSLFRCAGAGAPVSNMTSAYGGIRWESGLVREFQYEHEQSRIGGTLWEKPWHFIENSPLFKVPDVTTPILIMHNDNDGAVPYYQSIEFFTALRRLHKPAWMLVYNGEEHNLKERRNCKDLSIRLQQFFDHYLQDAPMPVWMKEGVPAVMKGKTWGLELVK
jgi:dipeptidyl aminopeptidase/acylaminoacyl peptidase